ncbi:MAG: ATP-binding protein [Candidatus Obscuribacterales bacterium]|nr:ATP-binding protein [Candidatus Obscuribacterales bacterium]
MKSADIFVFEDSQLLGKVAAVDTSRVSIAVESPLLLPRAAVGSLVAIQGNTHLEYLIGMTERVTRQLRELIVESSDAGDTALTLENVPDDSMRVVLIGTFKALDGSNRNRFKRGADSFPQIDKSCYLIEGVNLQRFMGLLGHELGKDQRLELGSFVIDQTAIAVANGDKFFQRHAAILGSTGSGKSYAVSLILERCSARPFVNMIVFDMHGEYSSLATADAPIAKAFKIAGPGDLDSVSDETIFLPYWLLNREEMLSMILDRSDQNAPNQASRFTLHVRTLKEQTLIAEKKDSVMATFTVDSPIPYKIADLLAKLNDDDTSKGVGRNGPVKGDWEGKLTRFVSRLSAKLEDRRYGFMFNPPGHALKYDWLSKQITMLLSSNKDEPGIKIVDFSEVPSDVLPVVAGVLARLIYDVQFWMDADQRTPFVFVCDEAHLYLPVRDDADAVQKQALYSFERIAKEGRKYGVSLLVVSQRPSDVSRTILSQCNNFLVLRLTNDQDQGVVHRLMPDSLGGILDVLPLLDTGEAFLLGDAILLPARIRLNLPRIEPLSATRDFWREWGERAADKDAIQNAVETLRRQSRTSVKKV